jgi:hypothetical protein
MITRRQVLRFINRTNNSVLVHGLMSGLWALLLIPTLLWWRESILWVAFMSLYANFVGHLSALEAALAKSEANRRGDL